ncbi:fluoride efflux transporter CrcB [bacterium]|nr:fluoride efflux transporter CrcB [bacterium]
MQNILAVAAGGSIGAVARYLLTLGVQRMVPVKAAAAGTLFVNVLGCLLIGVMMTLAEKESISPTLKLVLVTGLLGSLTTFSTFGFETIELARAGRLNSAIINVVANLAVGLPCVLLGRSLVSA